MAPRPVLRGFRGARSRTTDPPQRERGICRHHTRGRPRAQRRFGRGPRAPCRAALAGRLPCGHTLQAPAPAAAGRPSVEVRSLFAQRSQRAHPLCRSPRPLGLSACPLSPAGREPHLRFPQEKCEASGPEGSRGSWQTGSRLPRSRPGSDRPPHPESENTQVRTTALNLYAANSELSPDTSVEHRASPCPFLQAESWGHGARCGTRASSFE